MDANTYANKFESTNMLIQRNADSHIRRFA